MTAEVEPQLYMPQEDHISRRRPGFEGFQQGFSEHHSSEDASSQTATRTLGDTATRDMSASTQGEEPVDEPRPVHRSSLYEIQSQFQGYNPGQEFKLNTSLGRFNTAYGENEGAHLPQGNSPFSLGLFLTPGGRRRSSLQWGFPANYQTLQHSNASGAFGEGQESGDNRNQRINSMIFNEQNSQQLLHSMMLTPMGGIPPGNTQGMGAGSQGNVPAGFDFSSLSAAAFRNPQNMFNSNYSQVLNNRPDMTSQNKPMVNEVKVERSTPLVIPPYQNHPQVRTMTPTTQSSQKQRVNSWTVQEEAFLLGVVVAKYLSQGSLFSTDKVVKKSSPKRARLGPNGETLTSPDKKRKRNSKSDAIQECWDAIKTGFDAVWSSYTAKTNQVRPCERTSQALARHYKVMKTRLKKNDVEDFHGMYQMWRDQYDVNHSLLHPDYFSIQDFLREKSRREERISAGLSPVDKSYDSDSGDSLMSRQRVYCWNKHEEIILVGVVVDRFIKRGSLVSPRNMSAKKRKSNSSAIVASPSGASDEVDNDCWSTIKRAYDLAWERFRTISGTDKPFERTVNALSRHYKAMRSRVMKNIRRILESGRDSNSAFVEATQADGSTNKNDHIHMTLSQMYDIWLLVYNKNNVLISPGENI